MLLICKTSCHDASIPDVISPKLVGTESHRRDEGPSSGFRKFDVIFIAAISALVTLTSSRSAELVFPLWSGSDARDTSWVHGPG